TISQRLTSSSRNCWGNAMRSILLSAKTHYTSIRRGGQISSFLAEFFKKFFGKRGGSTRSVAEQASAPLILYKEYVSRWHARPRSREPVQTGTGRHPSGRGVFLRQCAPHFYSRGTGR